MKWTACYYALHCLALCINGWEIVAYNRFTLLFMSASPGVYNLWSAISMIWLYTSSNTQWQWTYLPFRPYSKQS